MSPDLTGASDLRGKHVIDNRGVDVGAVEDVEIDTRTWTIQGVVVKVRREVVDRLPMEKPLFREPRLSFGPERIESYGDNILLNVSVGDVAGRLSEGPR